MRTFLKVVFAGLICAASARAEADAKLVRTWKAKCASCHGADGKGDTETGKKAKISDFTKAEWQKSKTDEQLKSSIENGVKKEGAEMDPYKDKLDAAQIDGLVKHIRTLKK
jgi:mono/diheme cytochrome c family protein